MTESTRAEVLVLVQTQLGRMQPVLASDRLIEDLGLESVDLVMVVATLEDRFAIAVPEQALSELHTVADLVGIVAAARPG